MLKFSFFFFTFYFCTLRTSILYVCWSISLYKLLIFISLIFFIFLYKISSLNSQYFRVSNYSYLFLTLIILLLVCFNTNNLISSVLLIETVGSLYYFFFLQYTTSSYTSLIKYKNLISQYLWLSFYTLLFLSFSVISYCFYFGAVSFKYIQHVNSNFFLLIPLFIALGWKLGLPGFHFFKLEIYKFLEMEAVIFFSLVTLVVNTFLLIFFLLSFSIVYYLNNFFIAIVMIANLVLVMSNSLRIDLATFLTVSSINTWVFFILSLVV